MSSSVRRAITLALSVALIATAGCSGRDASVGATVVSTTSSSAVTGTPVQPASSGPPTTAASVPQRTPSIETSVPNRTPVATTAEPTGEPTTTRPTTEPSATQPTTTRPTATPTATRTSTVKPTATKPKPTASKTKPTKPAIFTQTPPASFPVLPFGTYSLKAKGSFLDYGQNLTEAQVRMNHALNSSPFPTHQCVIKGDTATMSPRQLEKVAQAYATCLRTAWQGLAQSKGSVPLPQMEVRHCAIRTKDDECINFDVNGAAALAASDGGIYLNPSFPYGYPADYVMIVMAHEVAHHVQFGFMPVAWSYGTVVGGAFDMAGDDGSMGSRRMELQAQCWAVGMVKQGKPLTFQDVVNLDQASPSDRLHWDYPTVQFWVKQGLKGQIGECNAPIAAAKLVSYSE